MMQNSKPYCRAQELEQLILDAWAKESAPGTLSLYPPGFWLNGYGSGQYTVDLLGGKQVDQVCDTITAEVLWGLTPVAFFYYLGSVLLQSLRTAEPDNANMHLEGVILLMVSDYDLSSLNEFQRDTLAKVLAFVDENCPEEDHAKNRSDLFGSVIERLRDR